MKAARAPEEPRGENLSTSRSPQDQRKEARDQLTLILSFFSRVDAQGVGPAWPFCSTETRGWRRSGLRQRVEVSAETSQVQFQVKRRYAVFVKRYPALFLPCLLLASCVSLQSQQTHEESLPSGKKIRVIAEGQIKFRDGSVALMLKYQTDLKISDATELRKEVDEIWPVFRQDVERLKLQPGIISVNEVPSGFSAKGYNFVYQRQDDGSWLCLDDKPKFDSPPKQKK